MNLSRNINRILVAGSIIAVGLITIVVVRNAIDEKSQTVVFTETVQLGTIEETVLANGVLEPARIVSVGAQVSGQLKALHVELGQHIKAGDLIAEIDPTPQAYALRIAEASLANVKAQQKARSIQLKQAEQAYIRQRDLARERAASEAEVESLEAAFRALEAEVESLEAQIDQAVVEVENAEANLGYTM